MNISVCLCIHHEPKELIRAYLRQFPPWVSKILVLVSEVPWFGRPAEHAGETMRYLITHEDPRLEVRRMNWRKEHEQRNWGMGRLADSDWVLIMDTDEFLTPEDWDKFKGILQNADRSAPCVVATDMRTYWKSQDYVWEPQDTHKPIIAANPMKAVFFDKRCITEQAMFEAQVRLYHLSWVKTDDEVLQKISTWMHTNDFDKEKWYNDVWKVWTPEMVGNLRPYGTEGGTRAVFNPLPDSIKRLFVD